MLLALAKRGTRDCVSVPDVLAKVRHVAVANLGRDFPNAHTIAHVY